MQSKNYFLTFLIVLFSAFSFYQCATLTGCKDVLEFYKTVGYPVTDCLDNPTGNNSFWRLDNKIPFDQARSTCRSAGDNADLATVSSFSDQRCLNDLFTGKYTLNTWMWLGIVRNATTEKLVWLNNEEVPIKRWYPYPQSTENGDCAIMLILSDPDGEKDVAGTWYYTEPCDNIYIAACEATDIEFA